MNLVLISLDAVWGGDWELLLQKPHIGPLLHKGLRCKRVQTVYPTLTYPIHVSMVTGKKPREHGIGHNQPYDAAQPLGLQGDFVARIRKAGLPLDACRPWYWDHQEIKTPTLFDACHKEGKKVCSILWPVTGKHRGIRWNFPEVLAMPWENQTLKMLRYGSPLWLLETEVRLGKQRQSTQEPYLSDYAITLAADRLRRKNIPHLTAIHLVDTDAMRHHHGVYSREALAALDRQDQRVGRILQALKEGGHEKDTCLMLVSDHGQEDVETPICLGDALPNWHVQVQSLGRGAYLRFTPGYEKEAKDLAKHLGSLPSVSAVYDEAAIAALGGPGDVLLAVDAAPGVVFADGLAEAKREKATHGFGTDHPTAQCILSLTGPGIENEERAEMQVTDIASLCAQTLGLTWRPEV